MEDRTGEEDSRASVPEEDLRYLQCHVINPNNEATTLCGLSGEPFLVFLSDEVRLEDVSCPLCRHGVNQRNLMADKSSFEPEKIEVMPLLVVFGMTGFVSTFLFSTQASVLLAILSVFMVLLTLPKSRR